MENNYGKLYLVSVPIGDPDDISIRAKRILAEVQSVICEERKEGSRLLRHYQLQTPILLLNEHNESQATPEYLQLLRQGQSLALISDCGTPLFADPGQALVNAAITAGIPITAVPGASSLMAALVLSGMNLKQFYYAGFLPRKTEERRTALQALQNIHSLLVFLEAPYRLLPLLEDAASILGEDLPCAICRDLTLASEKIYRGTVGQLKRQIAQNPFKAEFVLLIDNHKKQKR